MAKPVDGIQPTVHPVFEPTTCSWQYIVACPETKEAAIIDPVLNFEPTLFTITSQAADALIDCILKNGYTVIMLLETHAHGDHLSASYYIQQTLWAHGQPHAQICIQENITVVQAYYAHKYRIPKDEIDTAFDHLFKPDEIFHLGNMTGIALHLPGHTPDHGGYKLGDNVFSGDCMFNAGIGNGRCDFPGGNPQSQFHSMQRLLSFPPETKLYTGHDFPPKPSSEHPARNPLPFSTIAEQKEKNRYLEDDSSEDAFIKWRKNRDETLGEPRLMHQALQINIRGERCRVDPVMARLLCCILVMFRGFF
ncbi:uncharacterized protein N7511_006399 [Penicillium nucicola]|uniref:uncharacterized protein n=1 Tax=Penicillium nucicola TaxID=1850975 RepID=UPI002544FC75|nr:uncharacterized protein N7511_006399 [Penicillium nucicola]KAJ5757705.1 hypothetical protein N7511_006399 [Penicillium nucicola]